MLKVFFKVLIKKQDISSNWREHLLNVENSNLTLKINSICCLNNQRSNTPKNKKIFFYWHKDLYKLKVNKKICCF